MQTPTVGTFVSLMQPSLHGPRKTMGKVVRVLENGLVEVRLQMGGYDTVPASSLSTVEG